MSLEMLGLCPVPLQLWCGIPACHKWSLAANRRSWLPSCRFVACWNRERWLLWVDPLHGIFTFIFNLLLHCKCQNSCHLCMACIITSNKWHWNIQFVNQYSKYYTANIAKNWHLYIHAPLPTFNFCFNMTLHILHDTCLTVRKCRVWYK